MSKEKEYAKNTFILLIGKFATQFMSLLLVPLYTYFLLTDDYGFVDLMQTYILLFVPIMTLKLDSVAFRFLIDERKNEYGKKEIITNIVFLLFIMLFVFSTFLSFLFFFINIKYKLLIFISIIILMISNVFLQFLRGLGKNKEYTISAILSACISLIVNFVFIVLLKSNASSILIALIISNIASIIYIIIKIEFKKYIQIKCIKFITIKEILKYSIPMIPNELSWWIVNVSDRTMITYYLGASFNGIYTISCKFSNIINTIFGIFNISWQETASMHINDKDCTEFFTLMINRLFNLFSSISILILSFLPFVYGIIVGSNYYDSYNYVPVLLLGNILNILVSLIGGIYVAKKKVRQVAYSTVFASLINIVINFLCINKYGLYAASFSTLIAYLVLVLYRYIDVQKYVKIKLGYKQFGVSLVFFVIVTISYYNFNYISGGIVLGLVGIYFLCTNIKLIKEGKKVLMSRISSK